MDPVDIEALRRQSDEALLQAISDPERALIATVAYQMIIECKREAEILAKSGEKNHPPKIDLVEEHRVAIETNFRRLGSDISVPRPDISNTTLKRWRRGGREPFYRPATAELGYWAWMIAHGQKSSLNKQITPIWEDAVAGYWFTAEIARRCPRLETSCKALMHPGSGVCLLSLEEYAIVYWTHRDLTGVRLDRGVECWLRTRCGSRVLNVGDLGDEHELFLNVVDESLSELPFENIGGRAMKIIPNAA